MKDEELKTCKEGRGVSDLKCLLGTREIKFRAWDSFNRNMLNQQGSLISDLKRFVDSANAHFEVGNGITIMQFIGEKAIHGRDIYEGDIIEISSRGLDFNCIVGRQGRLIPNDEFSKKWHHMLYRPGWENAKIIGNIYENPDQIDECT